MEKQGPEIVDLQAYRAKRGLPPKQTDQEVVTDVHFSMTKSGTVVPSQTKVAEIHVLAVLAWCLDLSTDMLDEYLSH